MKEGNQPFNAQKALRVACLVLADLILINLSAFLALYIRFEFDLKLLCETEFLHNMIVYSGINSVCTILIFYILKLYNSLWEFAGVSELVRTAVGCFFSTATTRPAPCAHCPASASSPTARCASSRSARWTSRTCSAARR